MLSLKVFASFQNFVEISFSKMNVIGFLAFVGACAAAPQYYLPSPLVYPHPANLLTSAIEDTLPNELRNDFYKNPRIAARLAQESWFINKEMQVKLGTLVAK